MNINKELLELQTNRIIKASAIIGSIIALAGAYTWYRNNFWKPTVVVKEINYDKGYAQLLLNGRPITLFGDSSFSAGANWAVRFGSNSLKDGTIYDRIELTKFGNVVDYIDERKP